MDVLWTGADRLPGEYTWRYYYIGSLSGDGICIERGTRESGGHFRVSKADDTHSPINVPDDLREKIEACRSWKGVQRTLTDHFGGNFVAPEDLSAYMEARGVPSYMEPTGADN